MFNNNKLILKYFNFLIEKHNFTLLPEYNYVWEIHTEFIGEKIIIKIIFDGSYFVEILKPKFDINKLIVENKRTIDYEYKNYEHYYLSYLDPDKKIYNSIPNKKFYEKNLDYCSTLLKQNKEIITGDLRKLTRKYRLCVKFFQKLHLNEKKRNKICLLLSK